MKINTSIAAIALAASGTSSALVPAPLETKTICLSSYELTDGSILANSCDQAANNEVKEKLKSASADRKAIDSEYPLIAKRVLEQVENNPVTKIESLRQYPDGLQIGFCFGRALMIHYLLLKYGVKQRDIAKIFSIGDIKLGAEIWRFHVAVLLRDVKHGYIVLDPLAQGVKPYEQWVDEVISLGVKSPQSRVRLYVTDPRKFLPAFGKYDMEQIQNPHLKEYFEKIGQSLANIKK
jgi:hypothetical protein